MVIYDTISVIDTLHPLAVTWTSPSNGDSGEVARQKMRSNETSLFSIIHYGLIHIEFNNPINKSASGSQILKLLAPDDNINILYNPETKWLGNSLYQARINYSRLVGTEIGLIIDINVVDVAGQKRSVPDTLKFVPEPYFRPIYFRYLRLSTGAYVSFPYDDIGYLKALDTNLAFNDSIPRWEDLFIYWNSSTISNVDTLEAHMTLVPSDTISFSKVNSAIRVSIVSLDRDSTYTLTIHNTLRDSIGNSLKKNYHLTFTMR